jgi:hypothetical protein
LHPCHHHDWDIGHHLKTDDEPERHFVYSARGREEDQQEDGERDASEHATKDAESAGQRGKFEGQEEFNPVKS